MYVTAHVCHFCFGLYFVLYALLAMHQLTQFTIVTEILTNKSRDIFIVLM